MDRAVLGCLQESLSFLFQARCQLEGEAAVAAAVNEDLARILKSLQSRSTSSQQQHHIQPAQQLPSSLNPPLVHPAGTDYLCRNSAAPGRAKQSATALQARQAHSQPAASSGVKSHGNQLQPQQQQASLQGACSSIEVAGRLPPSLINATRQFGELQQQLHSLRPGIQSGGASTTAAAAAAAASGFMGQLQQAYGSQDRQWPAARFTQQRAYVALIAAALWLMQVLSKADEAARPALQHLLYSTLHACSRMSNKQQQQQQESSDGGLPAAAVCWRNRCLRSILAAATHTEAGSSQTGADKQQAGVWLPMQTWKLLTGLQADWLGQTHRLPAAVRGLLEPCPHAPSTTTRDSIPQMHPGVRLCYGDPAQMLQHSKQQQKLQQLLMQWHVEQCLAPRLLECLAEACVLLEAGKQQMLLSNSAPLMTEEQCMALFKLLHALATASSRQGLNAACHAVHACLELPR